VRGEGGGGAGAVGAGGGCVVGKRTRAQSSRQGAERGEVSVGVACAQLAETVGLAKADKDPESDQCTWRAGATGARADVFPWRAGAVGVVVRV
jgi:hypothetical protein